jgi:hypothetical protein
MASWSQESAPPPLLLLLLQGVNYQSLVFSGEAHDEAAWRKRLHLPLQFLFGAKEVPRGAGLDERE